MNIDKANLMWSWVCAQDGRRLKIKSEDEPPVDAYPYYHSRNPLVVTEKIYKRVAIHRVEPLAHGDSSFSEDLVLAMATGANGQRQFRLCDAILICVDACERCLNSLAHQYGLDWGYPEFSERWRESGTKCEMCETESPPPPDEPPSRKPLVPL